ncbi:tetratricopeptide repeat protein, partial [bacterium]|nr:tetratricopeptide repeat protein [bacterium]
LVTLPFVLLLMDYWPLSRMALDPRINPEIQPFGESKKVKLSLLISEKIPLFILSAASIVAALYMQRVVGAIVSTDSLPMNVRLMNAIVSYGLYIKKMFFPFDLSVFYPRYSIDMGRFLIVSVALMILTAIALRQYRKRPYLIIGWLWFLGTLVPVLGLIQVGVQSMADRYAYVPFIGLFIMTVWYAGELALTSKYIKWGLVIMSGLFILGLSVVAWQRCHLWGDQFALWNDVLKNHKVAFAYNLRGLSYVKKGQYDPALTDYNTAIKLDKKFAAALNNRAILNVLRGEKMTALDDYTQAIRLNPGFADAYYNRALLYLESGKLDEAVDDFSKAVSIDPGNADFFNYRGVALRLKGEYERSLADFNQALKLNENFAEAYFNKGLLYQMQKQDVPAVVNFTHALRLKSGYVDARLNRGIAFASLGKYDQAIKD